MPPTLSCATRYPILLLHGLGFRDRRIPRYWGRIPGALEARGARVYYGCQDGWGTIEHNARLIRDALHDALRDSGAERVNIIAHSKGGLEARYLISSLGEAPRVASLTTISTPHRGSRTLSKLMRLPQPVLVATGISVNAWHRLLGDRAPDFHGACAQLTAEGMRRFNEENPDMPGVYYQSYAGAMQGPLSDVLMSLPYLVIRRIEGDNDGIVAVESARWGRERGVLRGTTRRGVSHGDEVDVRRMRLSRRAGDGVNDIPALYVGIVEELRAMGL